MRQVFFVYSLFFPFFMIFDCVINNKWGDRAVYATVINSVHLLFLSASAGFSSRSAIDIIGHWVAGNDLVSRIP